MLNQKSVPWLRKTEYISTEQSILRTSSKLGDNKCVALEGKNQSLIVLFRGASAKDKLADESLKHLSRERLLQIIDEGFEAAKTPVRISDGHRSSSS